MSAFEGKADIASAVMFVRLWTHSGHSRIEIPQRSSLLPACYPLGAGQGEAQPDSEQFRSAPRTGRRAHCRL